jgi:hypothetical protein
MPTHSAATPDSEEPVKIGIAGDLARGKIDRRVSVAPMMDWTDEVGFTFRLSHLRSFEKPRLLYVSSGLRDSARFLRWSIMR